MIPERHYAIEIQSGVLPPNRPLAEHGKCYADRDTAERTLRHWNYDTAKHTQHCLLYTSPSPRD